LGVICWLAPWATLAATAIFALSFLVWRIISLASILASLGFAACQLTLLWPALFTSRNWSLTAFSCLVPALILVRHRSNIARLLRGEEPRYRSGAQKPSEPGT
jgi:acyl phosphate:glycerol-3-phosphate acyltransferase